MAYLQWSINGQFPQNCNLQTEHRFVVGRKTECDLVLQPLKGISREHFAIYYESSQWKIKTLSPHAQIITTQGVVKEMILQDGNSFSVPPYDFVFVAETQNQLVVASMSNALAAVDETEKTIVLTSQNQVGVLRFLDSSGELELSNQQLAQGDKWIGGRDSSCEIYINNPKSSRRQFEIKKQNGIFLITDLGSVNGTAVNGEFISVADPTELKSGDIISILDIKIKFELCDPQFESRWLSTQSSQLQSPITAQPLLPSMPAYHSVAIDSKNADSASKLKVRFDFVKHRPKLIVGATLLLLVAFLFSDESAKKEAPRAPAVQDPLAQLDPEKKALIERSYKLLKQYYLQGKYQLTLEEIIKIRSMTPDYLDINDLERLSKEALAIQEQNIRLEQIERAKLEAEEKIQNQVQICSQKINRQITMEQLEDCLSPVLQFNPDHPDMQNLRVQVERIVNDRLARQAQQVAYQEQVQRLKNLFFRAESLQKKNKPLEAIEAYEKVIVSNLPDPQGLKRRAQGNKVKVQNLVNTKTASLQQKATELYNNQRLKEAILTLRKAKEVDPLNPVIPERIAQYALELKKQMMVLYQEGILEESFGNVEGSENKQGAKDKWKKILELDVTDGEYYKKAFLKLKKYGAL